MICTELKSEHAMIMKVLEQAERFCCSNGFQDLALRKELFARILEFLSGFADRLHHDKEEKILFELFEKEAVDAHCNPVPQMQFEHDVMRDLRKQMLLELDSTEPGKLKNLFRELKDTLSMHIMKEDQILFPMCETTIPQHFFEEIQDRYKMADKENKSKDLWGEAQELVERLSSAGMEMEKSA